VLNIEQCLVDGCLFFIILSIRVVNGIKATPLT